MPSILYTYQQLEDTQGTIYLVGEGYNDAGTVPGLLNDLATIKSLNIDAVMNYYVGDVYSAGGVSQFITFCQQMLDALQSYALKGIIDLRFVEWQTQPYSDLQTIVTALCNHPALYAWYTADEPASSLPSGTLQTIYSTIKAIDNIHPIWVVYPGYGSYFNPTQGTSYPIPSDGPRIYDLFGVDNYAVNNYQTLMQESYNATPARDLNSLINVLGSPTAGDLQSLATIGEQIGWDTAGVSFWIWYWNSEDEYEASCFRNQPSTVQQTLASIALQYHQNLYAEAASVLSGYSSIAQGIVNVSSGGLLLGGSIYQNLATSSSGGMLVGGGSIASFIAIQSFAMSSSGGVLVGGSSAVTFYVASSFQSIDVASSGGVLLGGSSVVSSETGSSAPAIAPVVALAGIYKGFSATWQPVAGATSYDVFYSLYSDLDATYATHTPTNYLYSSVPAVNAAAFIGLIALSCSTGSVLNYGNTYYVRVRAVNSSGPGPLSAAMAISSQIGSYNPVILSTTVVSSGGSVLSGMSLASPGGISSGGCLLSGRSTIIRKSYSFSSGGFVSGGSSVVFGGTTNGVTTSSQGGLCSSGTSLIYAGVLTNSIGGIIVATASKVTNVQIASSAITSFGGIIMSGSSDATYIRGSPVVSFTLLGLNGTTFAFHIKQVK